MKRLLTSLLLVVGLVLPAWGQTKTIITGNIQTVTGISATGGTVKFTLRPSSRSISYRNTGTIIVPTDASCGIDTNGDIKNALLTAACEVWGNNVLTPANSAYDIEFKPTGARTTKWRQLLISGSTYDLSTPVFAPSVSITPQFQIIHTNPVDANIMPAADNTFNLGSAQLGYANVFATNITSVEGVVATTYNGTQHVGGGSTFTDIDSAVNTITDGAVGGTVKVHEGVYNTSAPITLDIARTRVDFERVEIVYSGTGCAIQISASFVEILGYPNITLTSTDPSANAVCWQGGGANIKLELGTVKSTNALNVTSTSTISAAGVPGVTRTAGVLTVTTDAAHGLVIGDYVDIRGVTDITFNDAYKVVTVPTTTTFTAAVPDNTVAEPNGSSGGGTLVVEQYGLIILSEDSVGGFLGDITILACRNVSKCVLQANGGGGNWYKIHAQNGGGVDLDAVVEFTSGGGAGGLSRVDAWVSGGGVGGAEVTNGIVLAGNTTRVWGSIYFEDGAGVGTAVSYEDTSSNNDIKVAFGAGTAAIACTSTADDNIIRSLAQGAEVDACDGDHSFGGAASAAQITLSAQRSFDNAFLVNAARHRFPDVVMDTISGMAAKVFAATATGASTAQEDLSSYTLPANALGTSGGVRVTAGGTYSGVAGTKVIKLFFGVTAVVTCSFAAGDAGDWTLEGVILNRDATGSQRSQATVWGSDFGGAANTCATDNINLVIDTTANVVIKTTGRTSSDVADEVTNSIFLVEVF